MPSHNPNPAEPTPQIMILLFSNYSSACKKLRQGLKDEYLSHFKPVCVDNEQIRSLLLESSNIQVERVPCLLHVFADGTVAKYEAEDAFRWIANFVSRLGKPQTRTANPDGSLPTSSVSGLLGNIPPARAPARSAGTEPLAGLQGRKPQQVRVPEVYPDLAPASRRREPFQGLSSERDIGVTGLLRPVKGEGHSGMMRSSLPDMQQGDEGSYDGYNEPAIPEQQEQVSRRVQFGHGKQAKMIEDLTPEEEEPDEMDDDPSGMRSVPRSDSIPIVGEPEARNSNPDRGNIPNKGREKSSGIKNLASAIASARETEDQKYEQARQGPVRTQRSTTKHTPISL